MWRFLHTSENLCPLWSRNFRHTRFWSPPWQITLMVTRLSVCILSNCPEFCTSQFCWLVCMWYFQIVSFPPSDCQGRECKMSWFLKNYTSGSGMMTLYLSVRLTLIYIQMFIGTLLCALLHFCHMVTIETTQGEILQWWLCWYLWEKFSFLNPILATDAVLLEPTTHNTYGGQFSKNKSHYL